MHPFLTQYNQVALPKLKEAKQYGSSFEIPRVTKVVVNVGVGDIASNGGAVEDLAKKIANITGQQPVLTKARKAISGFKIRQGMVVGMKVTLRGSRMYDFLSKLTTIALPRTRDFRGLKPTGITPDGNLNIGIKDSIIFPEASQESGSLHGIEVTLVSTARTLEEARLLYESLGIVFMSEEELARNSKPARSGRRRG